MAKQTIDDPQAVEIKVVLYVKGGGFYHLVDLPLKMDGKENRYLPTHLEYGDGVFRLDRVSDAGDKVYYKALF